MEKKFYVALIGIINLIWVSNIMALELNSSAFQQGESIPKQYTCDGTNISPPLSWKDIPADTKSLLLIMEDPDATSGTWDHWIVYNIPSTINSFEENQTSFPPGILRGKNSWNNLNYGGPCPPDREHRYFFKLYALNINLPAKEGLTKQEIEKTINGHVIAQSELIGKYKRLP